MNERKELLKKVNEIKKNISLLNADETAKSIILGLIVTVELMNEDSQLTTT